MFFVKIKQNWVPDKIVIFLLREKMFKKTKKFEMKYLAGSSLVYGLHNKYLVAQVFKDIKLF